MKDFFIFSHMSFLFLNKIIKRLEELSQSTSATKAQDLDNYLKNEIIWHLQKALLSGEYYSEAEEKLIKISSLLAISEEKIITIDDIQVPYKTANPQAAYIVEKYIAIYLDLVRNTAKGLDNILTGQDGVIIDIKLFESYVAIKDQINDLNADSASRLRVENYSTYLLGLLLCYLDEYLECNEESLRVIRRIGHYLSRVKTNKFNEDVVELYKQKAEFLEFKIVYRNSHLTKDGEKNDTCTPKLTDGNSYKHFKDQILKHYNDLTNVSPAKLQSDVSDAFSSSDKFNIGIFHNFNKYYSKLSSKSLSYRKQKIDDVIIELCAAEKNLKGISQFDKIGFKSIHNLLRNTSFHLRLEIESANAFPDIIPHFQKYINGEIPEKEPSILADYIKVSNLIAEDDKFPDYHCYIILLKFLDRLINHLIENPEYLVIDANDIKTNDLKIRFKRIVDYIESIYQQALNDLKENLRKIKSYEAKPVYLTMKECLMPYQWPNESENGFLFLDSSYILPNNFEKISKKVESRDAFLRPKINLLSEAFEVVLSSVNVKHTIAVFEAKMKENDFKVVQVVALFVSIATFVLVNVKIFDNKTGLESFGIIIGLAACFLLFNLFLHFMFLFQFRGGQLAWKFLYKILLWLVFPIILITVSFLILNSERYTKSFDFKTMQEKIDQQGQEIESLKKKTP
jgi:hypothetical protein